MNIEDAIAHLTKAVQENTAVLREVLTLGASASAEALTAAAPKKAKEEKKALLTVVGPEPKAEEPAVEETPEPEAEETPEPAKEEPAPEESEVPDLPIDELRAKLKEEIKDKLAAPGVKAAFDKIREKFGVRVIKELTDEQVKPFYEEVLTW